jgi:hypothetical protein
LSSPMIENVAVAFSLELSSNATRQVKLS